MEKEKIVFKGSHPDSLYRVPVEDELGSGKLVKVLRLLRWPVALLLVCIALGVFVYFLMPDNMESDMSAVNSTFWVADPIAVEAVHSQRPHITSSAPETTRTQGKKTGNPTQSPGTKISEIDFYDAVTVTDKNEVSSAATSGPVVPTRKLPVPPVFPSHIAPEVQYGNERADIDKLRAPKILEDKNLLPEDSTLKPHITHKPEKPLVVSFKDGISITSPSTETIFKAETNNDLINYGEKYTTIVDSIPVKTHIPVYKDQRPLYIPEPVGNVNYNRAKQVVREPEIQEYQGQRPVNFDVNFTSGHSKLFGISIEDAGKMRVTTQSSVYNTRVSPTLPTWRNSDDTTTKKYPVNVNPEVPQCRSTRLALCRGVLPYDLASAPISIDGVDMTQLLPQIEYLVSTNCSKRVADFACALLEPECSPSSFPGQLPCYNLCKAITESCENVIPRELSNIFACNRYSKSECIPARSPCLPREFQCSDGSCVPRDWICDSEQDCPGGEDEGPCTLCQLAEFRCPSGGCILNRWLCDGYSDCPESEDESESACESVGQKSPQGAGSEPGEQSAGSAPAPAVRRPNRVPDPAAAPLLGTGDINSSMELLITSDSSNALKRNFTRRPSPSRLTPYSRPMLKSRIIEKPTEPSTEPPTEPPTVHEVTTEKHVARKSKLSKVDIKRPSEKLDASNEDINIGDLFEEFKDDKDDRKLQTREEEKPTPFRMKNNGRAPAPQKGGSPSPVGKPLNTLNRVIDGPAMMEKMAKEADVDEKPESLEMNDQNSTITVIDKEDELPPESPGLISAHASPCPSGELRCVDGRCITLAQLCDGTIDCTDHADEDNCYS